MPARLGVGSAEIGSKVDGRLARIGRRGDPIDCFRFGQGEKIELFLGRLAAIVAQRLEAQGLRLESQILPPGRSAKPRRHRPAGRRDKKLESGL